LGSGKKPWGNAANTDVFQPLYPGAIAENRRHGDVRIFLPVHRNLFKTYPGFRGFLTIASAKGGTVVNGARIRFLITGGKLIIW